MAATVPAYELEDDYGAGLPAGWTQHADEQGAPYFVHGPTGLSQWAPPVHTGGGAAASRTLEDHVLVQGIDLPLSSEHKPPGDLFSDLAALGRRQDSLPHTRKKRLKSTAAAQLPYVQALDVDPGAVLLQKQAEEAQAAAHLHRAGKAAHEVFSPLHARYTTVTLTVTLPLQSTSCAQVFSPEEVAALCSHLSATLADDPDVGQLVPMPASGHQLAAAASASLLLAKYLSAVDPESLDQRALNRAGQGQREVLSVT